MAIPPAPLFRDPIFDGAADPTIIWNREEKAWWLLYTNRRANVDAPGYSWVHGTDIGIASSADGQVWLYRGVLEGLKFERGVNTFWAPEVLWHEGMYHMYVSYVPGIPLMWTGTRHIYHYTSRNLWDWQQQSRLQLSSNRVIDACVYPMPNGRWRMWYKDEDNSAHTYAADSDDLFHWQVDGPVIIDCAHEGPNVFAWKGHYWMITDPWNGLGVYRSSDLLSWQRQDNILAVGGTRADDATKGGHADVLVVDDRAYVFYFTHPQRNEPHAPVIPGVEPYASRRTSIQVAELAYVDGIITCDRNAPFDFVLAAPQ